MNSAISALLKSLLLIMSLVSGCSNQDKNPQRLITPIQDGRYHPPLPKDAERTSGPVSPSTATYQVGNKQCNNGEIYSLQKWQWVSYEVCVDGTKRDHNPEVSVTITDAQYYWGGAWYRFHGSENTESNFKVGIGTFNNNVTWSDIKPIERWAGIGSTFSSEFSAPFSGRYNAYADIYLRIFWHDDPVECTGQCFVGYDVRNEFTAAMTNLKNAIARNIPMIYGFGPNRQMPVNYPGIFESNMSLRQDAYLVMIPNMSQNRLFPYLFGDTHDGTAGRCESNADAITDDGTRQDAEMWTPTEIFYRLGTPDVFFNANYFDIRPQQHGQDWQGSRCSTPVGMYFDNYEDGPTKGTHNKNKFFPGPTSFVSEKNETAPVDTMFFTHTKKYNHPVSLIKNNTNESKEAIHLAEGLIKNKYTFAAVSGTGLLFEKDDNIKRPQPDAGTSATTRIAIAYDNDNDRLYVLMGGAYRKGLRRTELEAFYRALGMTDVLELDGGGSASLGFRTPVISNLGDPLPSSSCPSLNSVWCSPITQPDRKARSIPSWMGLNVLPRP